MHHPRIGDQGSVSNTLPHKNLTRLCHVTSLIWTRYLLLVRFRYCSAHKAKRVMFTWYGTRQLESAVHLNKSSWKNPDFLDYVLPLLVIDTLPLAAVVLRALRFSRTCMIWWETSVAGVLCQENIAYLQPPKDFQSPLQWELWLCWVVVPVALCALIENRNISGNDC